MVSVAASKALMKETGALLEGHFLLSSGLHSERYFQCARLLQHPAYASEVGGYLAAACRDLSPDAVASPALGGVIIGHETGRALGLRAVFAERVDGALVLRRGFEISPGERIVVIDKQSYNRHWLNLWRRTAVRYWDIVVDLRGSGLAYLLLAGRRYVIGKRKPGHHRVEELGDLIDRQIDSGAPPPAPRLWLAEAVKARAAELLPAGPPILAVAPAANWMGKTWPAERFAALAERLLPEAQVLVCCGPGEAAQAQRGGQQLDLSRLRTQGVTHCAAHRLRDLRVAVRCLLHPR